MKCLWNGSQSASVFVYLIYYRFIVFPKAVQLSTHSTSKHKGAGLIHAKQLFNS